MKEYFILEETPYNINNYVLKPNYELFQIKYIGKGSYNVLPARVCELSYPQFLRMCRDCYGANIVGKGQLYPTPYFSKKNLSLTNKLITYLNTLMTMRAGEKRS